MKKYTIYQIKNNINGKHYIGKHETFVLDDGYMGSGKLLKYAFEKHGIENFSKKILHIFDTEEEMNAKEKELVTEEFCLREDTYNICVGGQGGFSYINSNTEITTPRNRNNIANENFRMKFDLEYRKHKQSKINRIKATQEYRDRLSKACKGRPGSFKGKQHTEETKQKMRKSKNVGSNNSQFGSVWITDGSANKKIKTVDNIPEGWYKGRVIKK